MNNSDEEAGIRDNVFTKKVTHMSGYVPSCTNLIIMEISRHRQVG